MKKKFDNPSPLSATILMKAFYFTPEDLEENTQGTLSRRQYWRFARWQPFKMGVFIMALPGTLLAILWFINEMVAGRGFNCGGLLLVLGGFAIAGWAFDRWRKMGSDLRSKAVHQIVGRISTRYVGGRSPSFYLKAGQIEFEVERPQYNAVQVEGVYRIYYLQRSREIVAIEWLEDSPYDVE